MSSKLIQYLRPFTLDGAGIDNHFRAPEPRWPLLATHDPRRALSDDAMPPDDANGALGHVTVAPDTGLWLSSLVAEPQSLRDVSGGHLPKDFRLGPTWTRHDYRLAEHLVGEAFELGFLRHPDDLLELRIETPSYAWTHGGYWFSIAILWTGRNRKLRLRSGPVILADLDPAATAYGIEAARTLLTAVATHTTSLLDDLAAEGVRSREYWSDAQTETEAAADRTRSRQHRLRRWLHRNRACQPTWAGADITKACPGLMAANSLKPTPEPQSDNA
jgi:hypothetical protein